MFKLSLRERIKFWRKNKKWLRKISRPLCYEQFGMIFYQAKDGSIWGAERVDRQTRIIQISKNESFYNNWEECCYETYKYNEKKQKGYIFGKKGIFYKKSKECHWECIFSDEDITGMLVNCQKGIVIIFRKKGKDVVYRINNGQLSKEALLQNVQICYVNDEDIYFSRSRIAAIYGDMKVLVKTEDSTYSYYFITENEMHNPEIIFEDCNIFRKFLCKELVMAYNVKTRCNVLVTLVSGKAKEHYCCDKFEKMGKYYLATFLEDSKRHFLKYVSEENIRDLGIVPESEEYLFVTEILGIDFYTIKSENGIILLAVGENKLEVKFFEGAVDVKLSEPYFFENGNIIELKPVVVY